MSLVQRCSRPNRSRAIGESLCEFRRKWRGSGEITRSDGSREQIQCRARYDISEKGAALTQSLLCASASYRVSVNSYVIADGENAQGYWSEVPVRFKATDGVSPMGSSKGPSPA